MRQRLVSALLTLVILIGYSRPSEARLCQSMASAPVLDASMPEEEKLTLVRNWCHTDPKNFALVFDFLARTGLFELAPETSRRIAGPFCRPNPTDSDKAALRPLLRALEHLLTTIATTCLTNHQNVARN